MTVSSRGSELGGGYTGRTGLGKVIVQLTLGFEHEVRSWLLGIDDKHFHVLHEVFSVTDDRRAAVGEQLDLHFDLASRRTCPFPADQRDDLTGSPAPRSQAGSRRGLAAGYAGPATFDLGS
ncbi:thioesterase family protein [Nocardia rhamnosiphila]